MTAIFSANGRPPEPIVRLDRISKSFEEGSRERVVLRAVSAAFAPGEFAVLVGKSGSGKSTLLNLVSGIDTPTAGEVWVAGQALTRLSERERTLFRRERIGKEHADEHPGLPGPAHRRAVHPGRGRCERVHP